MKSRPAAPQACSSGFSRGHRIGTAQRAHALQVAPVVAAGRGHVEMQRAHARLRGHHAQHVGRDVERGEREQPRRQAGRQRRCRRRRSGRGTAGCAARGARGPAATRRHSIACGSSGSAPASQRSSQSRRQAWYFSKMPPSSPASAQGLQRVGVRQVGRAARPWPAAASTAAIGQRVRRGASAARRRRDPRARRGHSRRSARGDELAGREELEVGGDRRARPRAWPAASAASRPAGSAPCPAPAATAPAPACAAPPPSGPPAPPVHWSGTGGSRAQSACVHLAAARSQAARRGVCG